MYNYGVLGLITSYVTNVNKLFSFRMNEVVVRYVGEAYVNQDYPRTGALIKFAAAGLGVGCLGARGRLEMLPPSAIYLFFLSRE